MLHRMLLWSALAVGGVVLRSAGAVPGEEVVVVFNSRMAESKAVADHYVQCRQVPASHVFGFDLPTGEDISRAEFRERLQKPLGKALEAKKLWRAGALNLPAAGGQPARVGQGVVKSSIRYAVLCYGVPLRIAEDPDLHEAAADRMRSELRHNGAAVDSELALLPLLEEKLPLTGPWLNPGYAATNPAVLHPTNGVLLVARLDGPSAAIAQALVDKALQAETNGLWGRAYFDLRNTPDPGFKRGDDWLRNAAEMCRRLGLETVVDEKSRHLPGRLSHEPHRDLRRAVRRKRLRAVHPAQGGVHARRLRLSPALVQRFNAAEHHPGLGRSAAGQGGHHLHGVRR